MGAGVAVDIAIMANVTSLQNNVATLSGALRAALTAAVVDPPRAPPLPAVTAVGSTMKLSAPGAIQLHSDRCLVTDLCDAVAFAVAFAARLEVALDGI